MSYYSIYGDSVGRDKNTIIGNGGSIYSSDERTATQDEVTNAITELRTMIAELERSGVINAHGEIRDPASLVEAVKSRSRRGQLAALMNAVASGAKDAILAAVKGGYPNGLLPSSADTQVRGHADCRIPRPTGESCCVWRVMTLQTQQDPY